ncbi:MAG TPA: nuclear transport factor 2 family protein [Terriglobales bacterium]|nr:nuclear transport factor 2 family protein [Terriglobales bacterium]
MCLHVLAIVTISIGFLVPAASAQKASEGGNVLGLEKRWTDAYRERNINILSSLLAEDFVITVEDGNTYGKEGYITHTADSSVHVDLAQQTDMHVHTHGNTAVITGFYHERGTSKGKPYEYHDRFTDVWTKTDGRWQVIASHYSVPVR